MHTSDDYVNWSTSFVSLVNRSLNGSYRKIIILCILLNGINFQIYLVRLLTAGISFNRSVWTTMSQSTYQGASLDRSESNGPTFSGCVISKTASELDSLTCILLILWIASTPKDSLKIVRKIIHSKLVRGLLATSQ